MNRGSLGRAPCQRLRYYRGIGRVLPPQRPSGAARSLRCASGRAVAPRPLTKINSQLRIVLNSVAVPFLAREGA